MAGNQNQPTNALAGRVPDNSPLNYLASYAGLQSGTKEYIKAYMHQFLSADPGDYTEKYLSPQGVQTIRELAAMNYGKKYPDADGKNFVGINDYPRDDPTMMNFAIGAIAPSNIRRVNISGVPYWQVLDRYKFNGAEDYVKQHGVNALRAKVFNDLLHGDVNPEDVPATMGLHYNMNFIVPVDPAKTADPAAVEAYRKQSSLGNNPNFPTATLGTQVVNALGNTYGSPAYNKVMP